MNERIQELALQAGGSHYPAVGGKTLEKFAELIIRECIKRYDEYGLYSSDQRSFIIAGNNVKKHFGVK